MTYFYDAAEKYGKIEGRYWYDGTYITPDGTLFDVEGYARLEHAGGFVLPFFCTLYDPKRKKILDFHPKMNI